MKKLLILLTVFSLISCREYVKNEDELYLNRTTKALELRQLINSENTKTKSYGSYFLIGGSYSNKTETDISIKVFAKVDGYFRVVNIPIENVRVNINNNIDKPTLQINYTEEKLTGSNLLDNHSYNINYYIINCPERYLPEKLLPIEL